LGILEKALVTVFVGMRIFAGLKREMYGVL
jgi:hypothetical protein